MPQIQPLLSETINYKTILSWVDWLVFFGSLVITFIAVYFGHRLKKKSEKKEDEKDSIVDIILMGRQLTLPLFIATLVATWYGGIFGVTQIAFEKGVYNFITQGVFWYVAYIIFAFFIVHKINHYEALTLPELVGKMFGPRSQKLSAILNIVNVLPIAYIISVGLFLQTLFGGSLVLNTFIGVSIVILYTVGGGFRAIVFSDFIQFFIMVSSVIIVFIFSVYKFGGIDFLSARLPSTHFELTGGETLLSTFSWGFIAMVTLVDPNFYQRCFAAKSNKVAKNGIIISTIIWFFFDICTTAGGLYARAVIPNADSKKAYLIYSLQILPNGLRGFILAGILATIISTIDSFLFVAGTTISYDLLPEKWRNKKWTHHLGFVSVGIFSIFFSFIFDGNIKHVWKSVGSFSAACLLCPMLFGHLFPNKLKDNDFILSSFAAMISMAVWKFTEHHGIWHDVEALYIGLISSIGVLVLAMSKNNLKKI